VVKKKEENNILEKNHIAETCYFGLSDWNHKLRRRNRKPILKASETGHRMRRKGVWIIK